MLKKWSRAKRLIKHHLIPHALVLMYHRVTTLDNDPHLLAVTPQNFACHLEIIRRYGFAITLQELVILLKAGKVPKRAVVITFDDGYADNLYQAKPLLEQYETPATVFVTAGHVTSQVEFWWDELDRLFLQPGVLPAQLRLNFNEDIREWDLSSAVEYSQMDYQRDKDWHIEREDEPTIRHRIFQELFNWLYTLSGKDKQKVLADLRKWAGTELTARSTHRTMTSSELISLAESELIEVGAHTMVHPDLASLPIEEQRSQIQQSKETLESFLKVPVISFAFPHGVYTHDTISVLRETGFLNACTSHPSPVWGKADPFQIPRIGVRDWDQQTFESWFKWWMDG
jgi:peptidoglycan/xylan/chitin deacetylase (PgdA/CDA1 family)